ncbi:MAG: NADH-quinone oxidoreductase subunit J [Actinomycetaceae bacterium]|nr:NADH-quinone oxidoreductase subunit J [Actinomycetaceae bacterium]
MNAILTAVTAGSLFNAVPPIGAPTISTAEAIMAVALALTTLACALGVAFARQAVHAAIYMIGVMLSVAFIYFAQGAPFLGAAQIVVYTGAIMMLFVFVIMLVGVNASDSPKDSKPAVIAAMALMALALIVVLIVAVYRSGLPDALGINLGNQEGGLSNPQAIAELIFGQYYFAMELVGMLLIVAAVGAVTLTHRDRLEKKFTQEDLVNRKMEVYAQSGVHPGQRPAPGTYAESNAMDVPAISGETGRPIAGSVVQVLRLNNQVRSVAEASPWTVNRLRAQAEGDSSQALHGAATSAQITRSGGWGMPGQAAPQLPEELDWSRETPAEIENAEAPGEIEGPADEGKEQAK